jgi:hypothetical protein
MRKSARKAKRVQFLAQKSENYHSVIIYKYNIHIFLSLIKSALEKSITTFLDNLCLKNMQCARNDILYGSLCMDMLLDSLRIKICSVPEKSFHTEVYA